MADGAFRDETIRAFTAVKISYAVQVLGYAAVYALLALAGLSLAFEQTNASPVWPPSGFAVALLICGGLRQWPAILLGAFLANMFTFVFRGELGISTAATMSLLIGTGNMLEAVFAVLMFRKLKYWQLFHNAIGNVFLMVVCALACCTISAGIGVTTLFAFQQIPATLMGPIFITWWVGDCVGIYILTPLCIQLVKRWPRYKHEHSSIEWVGSLALLLFLGSGVFGGIAYLGLIQSMPYLVIPVILWVAFRFDFLETTIANFVVCAFAVWHTLNGSGPLSSADLNQSLILLQVFVGVMSITSLAVVAAFSERLDAVKALETLNSELEDRIRERTFELKASKEESEALAAKAQQANSVKSMFLASMSHEIRTPLNGILGFASMLEDTGLNPKQQTAIDQIRQSGNVLMEMMEGILHLAEMESGKIRLQRAPASLKGLVKNCLDRAANGAEAKGLRLACELAEDLPEYINVDKICFVQVLNHLLSNAVKFTERGSIVVCCAFEAQPGGEGVVRIQVKDTGIGIPKDRFQEIFRFFTQADETIHTHFGGTGLGLAICDRLVHALGGGISVESEVGSGSCFSFAFPAACAKPKVIKPEFPSQETQEQPDHLKVLVAEDNPINRKVANHLLMRLGHKPKFAVDGYDAIAKLQNETFDVVFMDIQMPNLNGVEATIKIRQGEAGKDNAAIPIVALTAYTRDEDREQFSKAGMDGYLSKPVKIAEMKGVIANVLGNSKDSLPA